MTFARWSLASLLVVAGCGPELVPETAGSDDTSTSTSAPIPGSSSDPSATGATGIADSTSTSEGGSSSSTGEPEECMSNPKLGCDPLTPSACSNDEHKCTFDYHPKGGGWVCGCISGDAGPYEPCTSDYTPSDSCAPQQICSGGELLGSERCFPLCGSSLCSKTSVCLGDYCLETCDPLAPYACPGGTACVPRDGGFVCGPILYPRPAGVGEPCDYDGTCEHGLVCHPGSQVTGCVTNECCAAVCDTTAPEPCAPGEACVPLFDEPWPGSETLGTCTPA